MIIELCEEGNTTAEVSHIRSVNINTTKTNILQYKKDDCKLAKLSRGESGSGQKKLIPQVLGRVSRK